MQLSDPMSLHKYMFANSNPVIYCDPSGHDATLLHMVGAMGMGALLSAASYLAVWAISSIVDTVKGTNYSAGFNLKDLICSVALGALLGGLGWEFSVAFQAMHLTLMQYVGLSVFLILIGLDLKVWSYFEGKSGDVIWSAILGTLGDVSYVAGGASVGAAVNARNNPLGHHNYGNGYGNSAASSETNPAGDNASTSEDVYSFGNKNAPRGARPQQDFNVNDNKSLIGPERGPLPKGASNVNNVNKASLTGHYHKLPAGTKLPRGLGIIADGSDVNPNSSHIPGHYTVYPTQEMTVDEFNTLYKGLPWQYGGKKP